MGVHVVAINVYNRHFHYFFAGVNTEVNPDSEISSFTYRNQNENSQLDSKPFDLLRRKFVIHKKFLVEVALWL